VVDRAIVSTAPLKVYFQNISGMRTKAEQVVPCEFDVIVLVETWVNINFYWNEFFDSILYHVFRKDRDSTKTHCARGGGVIVAVRCNLRCLSIGLLIEDTLLDQVAVSIIGESESLQIVVSYIPPNGSYKLYKARLENITDIYNNLQDHQHICVIGDFNLSSLVWSQDPEHHSSLPSNKHQPHEILFIDDIFSMGLIQVNNIFNNIHKILDLVFLSADINFSLVQCSSPISNCDIHLGITRYKLLQVCAFSWIFT